MGRNELLMIMYIELILVQLEDVSLERRRVGAVLLKSFCVLSSQCLSDAALSSSAFFPQGYKAWCD